MKAGALIIASGGAAQNDAVDPERKIGSMSVVQRLTMTFHLAEVGPIVIVARREDLAALEQHASQPEVILLADEEDDSPMPDNMGRGCRLLAGQCDRILVTPVDIPLFSVETVQALLSVDAPLACPVCRGKRGHPILMKAQTALALAAYSGDRGLAEAAFGMDCLPVEVRDSGVYVRSDQFAECAKIAADQNRRQWRPVVKVQIIRETPFLGPGSWQLLSLIATSDSVRVACQQMGLSYSKAWKILNNLEEQLGYSVLTRKQGGKNGGQTSLTEQGKQMLAKFERFERDCNQAVRELFDRHYGPDEEEF